MSTFYFLIITCFFCLSTSLSGVIYELKNFKDLIPYVTPNTLLIFDIDETLVITKQMLGSDRWFFYRVEQLKDRGLSPEEALVRAIYDYDAVRNLSELELIEPDCREIINTLQQQGIKTIGLTLQGGNLATRTTDLLARLGINLGNATPFDANCLYYSLTGMLFKNGILFTKGVPKGPELLKFLNAVNYFPTKIVFVDDKEKNLKSVEEALEKSPLAETVEYIGLRYSYSDPFKDGFREDLADIQLKYSTFEEILSDSDAEKILNAK